MNRTATVPAGRSSSTPFQTQMIARQFTTVVVDVILISCLNGRPVPAPCRKTRPNPGYTNDLGLYRNSGVFNLAQREPGKLSRSWRRWRAFTSFIFVAEKALWSTPVSHSDIYSIRSKRSAWAVTAHRRPRPVRVDIDSAGLGMRAIPVSEKYRDIKSDAVRF